MAFRFIHRSFRSTSNKNIKLKSFNRFFSASYISFSKNETKMHVEAEPIAYERADATKEIITKSAYPSEYCKWGRQATEHWKASRYSHKFHVSMTMPDFIECYENLSSGEILKDVTVGIIGGIHHNNWEDIEEKVRFYDLYNGNIKIKIMVDYVHYISEEEFFELSYRGRCTDTVTIECIGHPAKTKKGDLCIVLRCFNDYPPYHDDSDIDSKYSIEFWQKMQLQPLHLNSMLNLHRTISLRPKVYNYIYNFLTKMDFEEGYATTRDVPLFHHMPLRTDTDALGLSLYMRPGDYPESYLTNLRNGNKRIYEMGYVCRYEVNTCFTAEFATCEIYMCNTDSNKLIQLIETLISGIVKEVKGSYKITYHPNGFEGQENEVDFSPPFKRIELLPELESLVGEKLPNSFTTPEAKKKLLDICTKYKLECPPPRTTSKLFDKLVEHFLGEKLISPTYLCNYPIIVSPFDKYCQTIPSVVKRFKMFAMKKQIANAYTLFNDPKVQYEEFKAQYKFDDDEYAHFIDEIFSTMFKHSFAPAAGCGMDIDRLLMLLRNVTDIKKVQFQSPRQLMLQVVDTYDYDSN